MAPPPPSHYVQPSIDTPLLPKECPGTSSSSAPNHPPSPNLDSSGGYQTFPPLASTGRDGTRRSFGYHDDKDAISDHRNPNQHPMGITALDNRNSGSLSRDEALLFVSFWIFGTAVVMQFGVVLTAANDLVGNSAPQGLILLAYTLPSILIRTFVPYIKFPSLGSLLRLPRYSRVSSDGRSAKNDCAVDYNTRLCICAASSFCGLQMLAWCECVEVRVFGIALASLSSNLGDMSFFQLATRYPQNVSQSMGGYAAGSGAAGLIGSFIYTFSTGSTVGASPSSVLSFIGLVPCIMLLTYFLLLPAPSPVTTSASKSSAPSLISTLSLSDKLHLVKPMVIGHMLPLATLMFLENITTQGILPTLLWHLPFSPTTSILNRLFATTRDFYPFFFTVYQSAIFIGRSSINFFRLPGHNRPTSLAYWILCGVEVSCVCFLLSESYSMATSSSQSAASPVDPVAGKPVSGPDDGVRYGVFMVAGMVFTMGLCGGLGMGNTYWRVGKKRLPREVWRRLESIEAGVRGRREEEGIWSSSLEEEVEDGEAESFLNQSKRGAREGRKEVRDDVSEDSEETVVEECGSEGECEEERDALLEDPELEREAGEGRTFTGSGRMWSKGEETELREFLISTIAMPDVAAIFLAGLLSLWVQPELCRMQVESGRELCKAAR